MANFNLMTALCVMGMMMVTGALAGFQSSNETHICCDGTVSEYDPESGFSCCGTQLFDWQLDVCCDGTLFENFRTDNTSYYTCCQDEETKAQLPYNSNKEVCCEGKVLPKPDHTKNYFYCAGELHENNGTTFCCGNKLVTSDSDSDSESDSDESDEICCGNEMVTRSAANEYCCEEKGLYRNDKELCEYRFDKVAKVYSAVLTKVENNHTARCDEELYDTHTHACCSDKVVEKDASLIGDSYVSCCESEDKVTVYNYSSHICCESTGEVLPIPADSKAERYDYQCCAGALYTNTSWFACCDDKIFPRAGEWAGECCGSELVNLNYTTEICCDDKVQEQNKNSTLNCCGDQLYDFREDECCGGKLSPEHIESKYARCCYISRGDQQFYDSRSQSCRADGIEDMSSEESQARNSDPLCQEAY